MRNGEMGQRGIGVRSLITHCPRVSSRIVARAVAAEVTRRKCFRSKIRLLTSVATILELTLPIAPIAPLLAESH